MEGTGVAWMGREGWQRGMPPPSHHPMTGYHHATRPPSEDDTWCRMKAIPYHAILCYTILYQAIPLQYHDASSQASEDDTWCGMKAYGRRGRASHGPQVRSFIGDHMSKPAASHTGYFVKPTIPFDRISSRLAMHGTAVCVGRYIWNGRTSRPNVCFTLPKVSQHTRAIWPLCSLVHSSFLQTQRSENKLGWNTCLVVRSLS